MDDITVSWMMVGLVVALREAGGVLWATNIVSSRAFEDPIAGILFPDTANLLQIR